MTLKCKMYETFFFFSIFLAADIKFDFFFPFQKKNELYGTDCRYKTKYTFYLLAEWKD